MSERGPQRVPAIPPPTSKRTGRPLARVDASTLARVDRALRWHAARAAVSSRPLLEIVPDPDTPGINDQ